MPPQWPARLAALAILVCHLYFVISKSYVHSMNLAPVPPAWRAAAAGDPPERG